MAPEVFAERAFIASPRQWAPADVIASQVIIWLIVIKLTLDIEFFSMN